MSDDRGKSVQEDESRVRPARSRGRALKSPRRGEEMPSLLERTRPSGKQAQIKQTRPAKAQTHFCDLEKNNQWTSCFCLCFPSSSLSHVFKNKNNIKDLWREAAPPPCVSTTGSCGGELKDRAKTRLHVCQLETKSPYLNPKESHRSLQVCRLRLSTCESPPFHWTRHLLWLTSARSGGCLSTDPD